MSNRATCPECDEQVEILFQDQGEGLKCPTCGTQIVAPRAVEKPAPSAGKPKKRRNRSASAGDSSSRRTASSGTSSQDEAVGNMIAGVIGLVIVVAVIWGIVAGIRWVIREANQEEAAPAPTSPAEPAGPAGPTGLPGGVPESVAAPFEVDPLLEQPDRPVYLADMTEFGVRMGPWKFGKGELGDGAKTPIKVRDVLAEKGLSVHPHDRGTTRVYYALGGKAETLAGAAGLNDHTHEASGPVVFVVAGDGRELWRSAPVTRAGGPASFRVDVRGVKVLELRATAQGGHFGTHAVWIDPVIEK
jgi:hypothetical protein